MNEADTCRTLVRPKLEAAGWDGDKHFYSEQTPFTDGRIIVPAGKPRRLKKKFSDFLLRFTRDITLGVVEAKSDKRPAGDGLQQAKEYAEILGLKFAYSTNGTGIIEYDLFTCLEAEVDRFPTPDELWFRYQQGQGLSTTTANALLAPFFNQPGKEPRYYQKIAIQRSVEAILGGKNRCLLTMATGTGKTVVAFQICWKLWSSGWNMKGDHRKPRILFLADRNVLVDDPKDKTFAPFGDARHKIEKGEAIKSREMYFATYQSIAQDERRPGLFREYAPDFFDLIVVDECHRGSARDESNWRDILEYFEPAFQLGMTAIREDRAKMKKEKHRPLLAPPYRWRDWAAKEDGLTGDELRKFINSDEYTLDGVKREGLLAYLRSLVGSRELRQQVIGNVFAGVQNRMESGYLLRDVINKVNGIHFDSTEEIHTLGHLYESMLKEMRDAAGDSGEFYTPRAVVRFMVTVTDPQLGETILDPAAGTGGFLVETYAHLEKQCKTVQQRRVLQEESIYGGEAKPMPYMLCQMNLLLHGLESPQISKGNSLEQKLTEIKDSERVDVILTNPPFGGEEERGILGNFPEDKQTAETALLFLQLIMRKLRMTPKSGRAGVVVPNGTLFGDGVCARIKQELLTKFNLHTIVRLPNGVFAPYTSIPTNLLFFDRNGPTERVWYYEQPLPEGRKNYTKTAPVQFEEFADCLKWWNKRKENERAWKVPVQQIIDNNFNLDIKNPNAKDDFEHLPPEQLADDILQKELRIAEIMREIKELLGRKP